MHRAYSQIDSECLVYHPPKSAAFGHQARIRETRGAWAETKTFVETFTYFAVDPSVRLTCHEPSEWTDGKVSAEALEIARNAFGPEQVVSSIERQWELAAPDLERAITVALSNDKWPRQQIGPLDLHFCYRFIWRDLAESDQLTTPLEVEQYSQDEISILGIYIRDHLFLQPALVFPAAWDSALVSQFLSRLDTAAPFRLRDQYFKRAIPAKKSGHWRHLKLAKGWRQSHGLS